MDWLTPERRVAVLTGLCGVFLALSPLGLHWTMPYWAILFGAVPASQAAWESIRERKLDINVLMLLAAIGSVALGLPMEAAILLFLFALSGALEAFALGRTKSAIEGLVRLRPATALVVTPEGDVERATDDLLVGDLIRVLPFQHVPADAVITEGATSVNEASMTGESAPVSHAVGDQILAGTQNLEGMIVAKVSAVKGSSALDRIVDLVREAQENKASGERISNWFGTRYTVFVIAIFLVSLALRMAFGQGWDRSIYASLTVFVALSPCALVIASPAASLSSLAWAARNGILVRGGEYIEAAGQVDCIAMDKTGTLTTGRPQLAKICACVQVSSQVCRDEDGCWYGDGPMPERSRRLLTLAASVEQFSTHPIAEAIVTACQEQGLEIPTPTDVVSVPGMGLQAKIDGLQVQVGQRRFFEQNGEILPPEFLEHVLEHQREGFTVAIVRAGDEYAALALGDAVRAEAAEALEKLHRLGVTRQVMLTGDTIQTAQAVAGPLGITEIHAGLMPADKEAIIDQLGRESKGVLMVGDGINDAPSLAKARLGVAMGGNGSDIALSAANAALMRDRLTGLPKLVALGQFANRVTKASLLFAGGVVVFLFFGTILADAFLTPELRRSILPLAVLGHEGSTVLVILNGLRLLAGPKLR